MNPDFSRLVGGDNANYNMMCDMNPGAVIPQGGFAAIRLRTYRNNDNCIFYEYRCDYEGYDSTRHNPMYVMKFYAKRFFNMIRAIDEEDEIDTFEEIATE